MHMSDALLSPAVGGAFWVASAAVIFYSAARLKKEGSEQAIPLMGVLGAFVFAAQMVNFAIPGTGSSGHIGGGMLLTMLLGPPAAFIVIASVLAIQCLFFADGGLLALGANIFNLGIFPCFLGYVIYRAIARGALSGVRLTLAAVVGTVVGLELGAMGVVIQTLLSGRSDIPFAAFAAVMAGIHLPIALVEGILTAAVVQFVLRIRPEVLQNTLEKSWQGKPIPKLHWGSVLIVSLAFLTILTGCFVSWFASSRPDGLEYSLDRTGWREAEHASPFARALAGLRERFAFLPEYDFSAGATTPESPAREEVAQSQSGADVPKPIIQPGTSVSGLVGSAMVLVLVACIGGLTYLLQARKRRAGMPTA